MMPVIAAGSGSMAQPLYCTTSVKPGDTGSIGDSEVFLGRFGKALPAGGFLIPHSSV
jgi:hypothetical protein